MLDSTAVDLTDSSDMSAVIKKAKRQAMFRFRFSVRYIDVT